MEFFGNPAKKIYTDDYLNTGCAETTERESLMGDIKNKYWLDRDRVVMVVVDVQEKLVPSMNERVCGRVVQHINMLLPERFRSNHLKYMSDFMNDGIDSKNMGSERVVYGQKKSGKEVTLAATIAKLSSSLGEDTVLSG